MLFVFMKSWRFECVPRLSLPKIDPYVNWWGAWCDNGGGRHGGRIRLHDNMLIVSQTEHILITAWMKVVRQNNVTHRHDSAHNKGNPIINVFYLWTDIFASILQWKYDLWTGPECYPTSICFFDATLYFPSFQVCHWNIYLYFFVEHAFQSLATKELRTSTLNKMWK